MDEVATARRLALTLSSSEAAIDDAIAESCRLIEDLIAARAELRLSATVGAPAGERLASALSALMQARSETAGAHAALAQAQASLGLGHLNLSVDACGPLDKPPPRTGRIEGDRFGAEIAPPRPLRKL